MTTVKNLGLAASSYGINYSVVYDEASDFRPFGILAESDSDKEDSKIAESLFFTKEEAVSCCLWLAKNQVYPITLCEVLQNFYR